MRVLAKKPKYYLFFEPTYFRRARSAQVKQLLYGPARRQRLGAADGSSSAMMEQEQESALLSELAEGDFSADQNIVEVSPLILSGRWVGIPAILAEG